MNHQVLKGQKVTIDAHLLWRLLTSTLSGYSTQEQKHDQNQVYKILLDFSDSLQYQQSEQVMLKFYPGKQPKAPNLTELTKEIASFTVSTKKASTSMGTLEETIKAMKFVKAMKSSPDMLTLDSLGQALDNLDFKPMSIEVADGQNHKKILSWPVPDSFLSSIKTTPAPAWLCADLDLKPSAEGWQRIRCLTAPEVVEEDLSQGVSSTVLRVQDWYFQVFDDQFSWLTWSRWTTEGYVLNISRPRLLHARTAFETLESLGFVFGVE